MRDRVGNHESTIFKVHNLGDLRRLDHLVGCLARIVEISKQANLHAEYIDRCAAQGLFSYSSSENAELIRELNADIRSAVSALIAIEKGLEMLAVEPALKIISSVSEKIADTELRMQPYSQTDYLRAICLDAVKVTRKTDLSQGHDDFDHHSLELTTQSLMKANRALKGRRIGRLKASRFRRRIQLWLGLCREKEVLGPTFDHDLQPSIDDFRKAVRHFRVSMDR